VTGLGAQNEGNVPKTGALPFALPLRRPLAMTLAESLRQKLEGAIAAGRLEPGSRLDEQEIAQRFGVSRTPVREAFRLMAANTLSSCAAPGRDCNAPSRRSADRRCSR